MDAEGQLEPQHSSSAPAEEVQAPARKLLWFKVEGQAGPALPVHVGADAHSLREVAVALRHGTSQRSNCRCAVAVDATSSQAGGGSLVFHSGLQVGLQPCSRAKFIWCHMLIERAAGVLVVVVSV